jgi:hypothetical protein
VCIASLVAVVVTKPTADAQNSQRQQEVRRQGIGITLKGGWQLLVHDGCRFAVPGFWHPEADGAVVFAPDGNNLSVRMFRTTNWSAHKAQIRAAFGQVKVVHEDSARRLWFEIGDQQRTQHFIDVSNRLGACAGLLEIRAATILSAEDVTRIAEGIGPVSDQRSPGSK